ncbi:uncharacterized protein [Macrobrachium rosenbergii]|uniref:uncharacterized protein n=1 Tax=Macrobrachium rosenbergii TaxID=79674 RepID=UPI0034D394CF
MGLLPDSRGYRYLFTIIDRNTKWPKAIPIQQQTAQSCTKALIGWVSKHGVLKIIMSDRGANLKMSTSLALKASLTARCQVRSWRKELPWVLLGLRTTPHTAFNASPAEVLYSQALTLPADVFQDQTTPTSPSDTRKAVEQIMPAKTTYHVTRKVYVPSELQNAKYAFIRVDTLRAHISPAYSGPYCIIQR